MSRSMSPALIPHKEKSHPPEEIAIALFLLGRIN